MASPFLTAAPPPLRALDAAAGIISRCWAQPLPSFAPPGLRFSIAYLSRTDAFGSPLGADTTSGCAWWDRHASTTAALGEALEWYAASLLPDDLLRATTAELPQGRRVEPAELALYSPSQLASPGFPFVAFDPSLSISWADGVALADGRPCYAPASITFLGYTTGASAGEPRTNLPVNAGVAAHTGWDRAVAASLGEVIERDALAEAWTFGVPLVPVLPPPWFEESLGVDHLTAWRFYRLPTVVDVAGVLAVVSHAGHRVVGVGAAVRPDPVEAARKAAAEAAVSAAGALELDSPTSCPRARMVEGGGPLSAWRQDRSYRRSYRDDWHDVVDISCHAQLQLDPIVQADLFGRLDELSAAHEPLRLESLPSVPDGSVWATMLIDAGFDPVVIDVTTSDVASLGWYVVRTVVPGLRATGPAAFPYLGETVRSRRHMKLAHLGPVPHV